MLIVGSCWALNLSYSGCCMMLKSPPCINKGCYCDQSCYNWNDCCSDIADIGCHHPTYSPSPTPTDILSKTKSESDSIHYSHSFLHKLTLINKQYKILMDFFISCVCINLYRIWIWLRIWHRVWPKWLVTISSLLSY